jgi:SNF2 family DNA or RNA helicase
VGTSYRVGDRVRHQVFGEGLVVEVRSRDFFDVLEIAFGDGVRKVTSIHPQLSPLPKDGGRSRRSARAEPATESPETAVGPLAARPRKASALRPVPEEYPFHRSAILHLDPESVTRFHGRSAPAATDPAAFLLHVDGLWIARQRGFAKLLALNHTRDVERLEHQIRACLRVLREMKGRALLADEVGLGKTIEAGLILKEYVLRGLVHRVLILAPASLLTQWREELAQKFDLSLQLHRRGNDWASHPFLIASLDTAKSARNRRAIAAAGFDLLIVDEAHRLRNHLTLAWKFIDALSLKYLLLLTATPVQNDLRELYNLITLLRPGALGTYRSFRAEFVARGDRRLPKNTHRLSLLLSDVMIRTTRSSTSIRFPRREVQTHHLELSPDERAFYDAVSGFVQSMASGAERSRGAPPWPLLLVVLQKEIGSSPGAAIGTLERAAAGRLSALREPLRELLEIGRRVRTQVKLEKLTELVEERRRAREKVLVFSQFRRTVEDLVSALRHRGARVGLFHGSLSAAAKDAAVHAFRDQLDVLVSTEAGGEGRNLQFCRTVVNYDLPWNPMRIEQRIGRVHRIGQRRDVQIVNLSARGTLEAYVLQVLQEKIQMFQLVIGEMEQILGNLDWTEPFETQIFRLWAGNRKTADRDRAFAKLGTDLEHAHERYEHVKTYDREIFEGTEV